MGGVTSGQRTRVVEAIVVEVGGGTSGVAAVVGWVRGVTSGVAGAVEVGGVASGVAARVRGMGRGLCAVGRVLRGRQPRSGVGGVSSGAGAAPRRMGRISRGAAVVLAGVGWVASGLPGGGGVTSGVGALPSVRPVGGVDSGGRAHAGRATADGAAIDLVGVRGRG